MKNLLLLTVLLIGGLFTSCSSSESGDDTPTPVTPQPSEITISTISNEFFTTGDVLEITGENFTNNNYPTKILINGTEVAPKELSDTKIQLLITDNFHAGANTIILQIEKVSSNYVPFYFMPKGWNKLNPYGNVDVLTSNVFDDSRTIFSFVDNNTDFFVFDGTPKKLEGKSTGYIQTQMNQSGSYGAFKMIDDKIGVLTTTTQSIFTDNCFEIQKKINVNSAFNPIINGLQIGYLDNKSCIINTALNGQIYTADKGQTIIKNNPPEWAIKIYPNSSQARISVTTFGKSISNDKFYQLGILFDSKKYGANSYKNIVLESETGYSNWIVKDSVTNAVENLLFAYKFLNINKIFAINPIDKTLQESNDLLKTWKTIKTDVPVTSIFLRTETQWYIQSEDKIYSTTDAGQTWSLELELPAGSFVNDISFSNSKIIVSGNNGLLYLKLE